MGFTDILYTDTAKLASFSSQMKDSIACTRLEKNKIKCGLRHIKNPCFTSSIFVC